MPSQRSSSFSTTVLLAAALLLLLVLQTPSTLVPTPTAAATALIAGRRSTLSSERIRRERRSGFHVSATPPPTFQVVAARCSGNDDDSDRASSVGDGAELPPHTSSSGTSSSAMTKTKTRRRRRSRRDVLRSAAAGFLATFAATSSASSSPIQQTANAAGELPMALRDYTKLAPLGGGGNEKDRSNNNESKTYNLPLEEIAKRLTYDLTKGASGRRGKGGYIVSGDISNDLFRDDCVFVDPTNRVQGLSKYRTPLRILFDPERSIVEIVDPLVVVDSNARTITGKFRSRGFLQLPWNPYVASYESTITYQVDEDGLISQQSQAWTKSAATALRETFTPTIFTPPPKSTIGPSQDEPALVSKLFDKVNGRRPGEYSNMERSEIDSLIDRIASTPESRRFDFDLLPGKWMSTYLQPGPDGTTFDRRIPFFPEFSFNDNYQIFRRRSSQRDQRDNDHTAAATAVVTNVGEIWGPYVDVRVCGTVDPVSSEGGGSGRQRLRADIQGGAICANILPTETRGESCIGLPMIKGEGLFESVYLGRRLRVGQNLNGGGARVVQVRLE